MAKKKSDDPTTTQTAQAAQAQTAQRIKEWRTLGRQYTRHYRGWGKIHIDVKGLLASPTGSTKELAAWEKLGRRFLDSAEALGHCNKKRRYVIRVCRLLGEEIYPTSHKGFYTPCIELGRVQLTNGLITVSMMEEALKTRNVGEFLLGQFQVVVTLKDANGNVLADNIQLSKNIIDF